MESEQVVITSVIAGSFVMVILVLVIVLFVAINKRKRYEDQMDYERGLEQKQLEVLNTHIRTQEVERERIARNLHDDVNPLLSALKFHLKKHELLLERQELSVEHLGEERKFIDEIMAHMRVVSHNLSPNYLLRNGLVNAIKSYIFEIPNINTDLVESVDEGIAISDEKGVNIFRIVLELTTNIIKHDSPSDFEISITLNEHMFEFLLVHDGKGMSNKDFLEFAENSNGLGLNSLRSRVTLLNADLDFQNEPRSLVKLMVRI